MHNEQRPEGKKAETERRHLVITKGERWKDGQRRCPKRLCTHSAWLPIGRHGNCVCMRVCVCALMTNIELEGCVCD